MHRFYGPMTQLTSKCLLYAYSIVTHFLSFRIRLKFAYGFSLKKPLHMGFKGYMQYIDFALKTLQAHMK